MGQRTRRPKSIRVKACEHSFTSRRPLVESRGWRQRGQAPAEPRHSPQKTWPHGVSTGRCSMPMQMLQDKPRSAASSRVSGSAHSSRVTRLVAMALTNENRMGRLPDKACRHCGRWFSCKGVYEHERFHCGNNKNRQKRSYSLRRCPDCDAQVHEKHLSTHRFVQHDVVSPRSKRARSRSPGNARVTPPTTRPRR